MSDDPTEPTTPLSPDERLASFETVGPASRTERGSRRAVIAGVAVAVVALLGGGAYAAYSFLKGGGTQPAEVLPAETVAVVSIDLDPSAGQKIAAIRSIRKFPALRESLGLKADDDLRRFAFDKALDSGHCDSLSFDKDIKPWLGKRAALAAVDLGDRDPAPALAIQVNDPAKARRGFDAIVRCTRARDFAFVVGDDYVIASDTHAHAQAILDGGRARPLSEDASYRKWTSAAGDAGVVNFYVAKRATSYLSRLFGGAGSALGEGFASSSSVGSSAPVADPSGPLGDVLKGFTGLAGTVRFAGGGMELGIAAGGLDPSTQDASVRAQLGSLPDDTAVAVGMGIPPDFAKTLVDQLGGASDDLLSQAEDRTGLSLPGDLQTLLGSAVSVSLGGQPPASATDIHGPQDVPAGVLIHGDADRIKAVIAKIEQHSGLDLSGAPLVVDSSGDKVAVATSSAYAATLLKSGGLGSAHGFTEAVPDAGKASQVLYVDFDSPWRDVVTDLVRQDAGAGAAKDFDQNTSPLRSLGISAWRDGDVSHELVKVTTD